MAGMYYVAHMSHDDVVASTVAPPSVPSRRTLLPRAEPPLLRTCRPVQAKPATATYVAKPAHGTPWP